MATYNQDFSGSLHYTPDGTISTSPYNFQAVPAVAPKISATQEDLYPPVQWDQAPTAPTPDQSPPMPVAAPPVRWDLLPEQPGVLPTDEGAPSRSIMDRIASLPSDIVGGAIAGLEHRLPEQVGQAMEWFNIFPETGKKLAEWGREGDMSPEEREQATFVREGAEMIAPSVGVSASMYGAELRAGNSRQEVWHPS